MDKWIEEKLYTAAADLFEADSVLDLDKDEYVRGMSEIMADFLGKDKYDVVVNIQARLGQHMLTSKDIIDTDKGLLYVGPLKIAQDFIKGPNKTHVEVFPAKQSGESWRVEFDEGNVWGSADTEELAWRYALGGEFGPTDEGFEPFMIHR